MTRHGLWSLQKMTLLWPPLHTHSPPSLLHAHTHTYAYAFLSKISGGSRSSWLHVRNICLAALPSVMWWSPRLVTLTSMKMYLRCSWALPFQSFDSSFLHYSWFKYLALSCSLAFNHADCLSRNTSGHIQIQSHSKSGSYVTIVGKRLPNQR